MARRSTAEIKKLLKETKTLSNSDAAKKIGISIGTFYKWKEKVKSTSSKTTAKTGTNKKVLVLLKDLKAKVAKLEQELIK